MNVPPVDNNFYVRTLRSRNIIYDIRHRQIDNQTNTGQKPDIPPRPNSLQTNSKVMTHNISTHLPNNKEMTIGNTFRQEHVQIPTPTPRCDKYSRQEKPSSSPQQNYPYDQNTRDGNTTIQPKLSNLGKEYFQFYRKRQLWHAIRSPSRYRYIRIYFG